ncbi:MAG: hypothetical protein AAGU27_08990 [Dehalobacterium sp.]
MNNFFSVSHTNNAVNVNTSIEVKTLIQDKVVFGGLIGVLANISMNILQFPIWKLKIIKHPLSHYAASIFLEPQDLHHMMIGSIVSFLADYIYGAFLGVIFVYIIYLTGKNFLIIKGLIFGSFLWVFSFGGLGSLPIVTLQEVISADTIYYLLFHLVFGITLGILVKKYGEQALKKT